MILLVAFAVSALFCAAAFGACYLADHPWLIPALPTLQPRYLPAGPYYCEATRRWRDPATQRFVAAPAR